VRAFERRERQSSRRPSTLDSASLPSCTWVGTWGLGFRAFGLLGSPAWRDQGRGFEGGGLYYSAARCSRVRGRSIMQLLGARGFEGGVLFSCSVLEGSRVLGDWLEDCSAARCSRVRGCLVIGWRIVQLLCAWRAVQGRLGSEGSPALRATRVLACLHCCPTPHNHSRQPRARRAQHAHLSRGPGEQTGGEGGACEAM
jgi:hypothetical protein